MDTLEKLTVDEIQGYIAGGAKPLPFIYEHFLKQLYEMEKQHQVSLLPIAIFEVYHLKLKRKLVERIAMHRQYRREKAA